MPNSVIHCEDLNCDIHNHIDECDNYVKAVLDAVDLSSSESLHVNKHNANNENKTKVMPGFDSIRPAKDTATFWHSVWVSCNKPHNTQLHQIMKRTRSIYHYQIRKIKAAKNKIKANKLVEASLNGGTDLFKEIKKLRKSKISVANKIDGNVIIFPIILQKSTKTCLIP